MPKEVILRNVVSIILGVALVFKSDIALKYMVVLIGIVLMVIGAVSLVSYFRDRKKLGSGRKASLVTMVAGIVFGLVLVLRPEIFINVMMYVLGFLVLLAGGFQIYALLAAKDRGAVFSGGLFVVPALILISGAVMLFYPFSSASTIVVIFGVLAIVYGVIDLYNHYILSREAKDMLE